jgi:hypothetical protein
MIIESNIKIEILDSPTQSFIYFSVHSFTHLFTHPLIYSLTCLFTHPHTSSQISHSLVKYLPTHSCFNHSPLAHTHSNSFTPSVTHQLTQLHINSLTHLFTCSVTQPPIHPPKQYHMIPVICMQRHLNSSW